MILWEGDSENRQKPHRNCYIVDWMDVGVVANTMIILCDATALCARDVCMMSLNHATRSTPSAICDVERQLGQTQQVS